VRAFNPLAADDVRARLDELHARLDLQTHGVVYLLAVLQRLDPQAAHRAATALVCNWDDSASLGWWAPQWCREFGSGDALTLRGFPIVPEPRS
jgi:hypothetical protein